MSGSYSFERGACSGRVILHLSPGLFSRRRHCWWPACFGPRDFALVPSCLPLHSGFFARVISGLSPPKFTFARSLVDNARFEAWIVTFGERLVENARFGSLDCHFW